MRPNRAAALLLVVGLAGCGLYGSEQSGSEQSGSEPAVATGADSIDPDAAASTDDEPVTLLLRGRIGPEAVSIDPVFQVDALVGDTGADGLHRLAGFDRAGTMLFDLRVEGVEVADGASGEVHFQHLYTTTAGEAARLHRVELHAVDGRSAERSSVLEMSELRNLLASDDLLRATSIDSRQVRLVWTDDRIAAVRVSEPGSGQVLAWARGGSITLPTTLDSLDVTVSDGVRSGSAVVHVR